MQMQTILLNLRRSLQKSVIKLLSKGLSLSVSDMSVKKITIENQKPIDGFSLMAKMVFKEDADLAKKIRLLLCLSVKI